MSRPYTSPFRWSALRGYNVRDTPQALPDDLATVCDDVELDGQSLGRRRPTATSIDRTSGPTELIYHLYAHYVSTSTISELWAFSGNSAALVHRRVLGVWSSVTLIDTPAPAATLYPICATLNDKNFIAYDSAENRLHVWDGTQVRRVGVAKTLGPTVADTGAGAYPATPRFYRVGWRLKVGSDIVATSELSPAVSFTPSGAGTAARIFKPAPVDNGTHWVVYGLIGTSGDTYDLYKELAEIDVATTGYDDSTLPSAYTGEGPMPIGTNIPPPSAKYLLATDNRLLMAGAFETTASSYQTTPLPNRVWFTRVLGTTDEGDDESIPNTSEQKNWIDVGPKDGDRIVGLGGPVDGVIYVFKFRSIWRLIPTGIDTQPYVADRVTTSIGANTPNTPLSFGSYNHRNIVVAENDAGQPLLYFVSSAGLYRLSPQAGIEYVGWDLSSPVTGFGPSFMTGVFVRSRRQLWFTEYRVGNTHYLYVFTPHLAAPDARGTFRGGWQRYTVGAAVVAGVNAVFALALSDLNIDGAQTYPVVGGRVDSGSTAMLLAYHTNTAADTGNSGAWAFTPQIVSNPWLLGGGVQTCACGPPVLEAVAQAVTDVTLTYTADWGRESRSATVTLTATGSETRVARVVGALELADALAVQVTVTYGVTDTLAKDAVTVPFILGNWITG